MGISVSGPIYKRQFSVNVAASGGFIVTCGPLLDSKNWIPVTEASGNGIAFTLPQCSGSTVFMQFPGQLTKRPFVVPRV
jgi:hypothetical protein